MKCDYPVGCRTEKKIIINWHSLTGILAVRVEGGLALVALVALAGAHAQVEVGGDGGALFG